MLFLMMRNITSDGFVFEDPANRGSFSLPSSVLAAPSFPANTPGVDQDLRLFNWVRDSAITMIEVAEARLPSMGGVVEPLKDYVSFATTCFNNAVPTKAHACFTVTGLSRNVRRKRPLDCGRPPGRPCPSWCGRRSRFLTGQFARPVG
jgi:glucoamylase